MGGRGATSSFNGYKAQSYVSLFNRSLELTEGDRRHLTSSATSKTDYEVTHFKSPEGAVKTRITIENGKELYELRKGRKVLIRTRNRRYVANRLANLYIRTIAEKNRK